MEQQIILMRHGQPQLAVTSRVALGDMRGWIEDYDRSVITQDPAPAASVQLAAGAQVIACSSAPRALSSAQALGVEPAVVDAVFCEAQLPGGRGRLAKLSPFTWAAVLRVLWLCGYSAGVESAKAAGARADDGARRLQSIAEGGPVLLVGHGIMNRLIGKRLRAAGWVPQASGNSGYWSAVVYRRC
ncbi:histidine phosphatase family protein [Pseudomonas sp. 02C 26]|uniref:histidine phosphatase family protein n=1 Tax=Pseudomonas sp. 02C 26 TaxID=2054914 RepID=UPI000C6E633F|nr:histidine phosphatase family protein [Pseudomonas sp. 02C 26]AUF94923.1 histidine phosphatase family protein [Pseudomonas sp. 02C 26]